MLVPSVVGVATLPTPTLLLSESFSTSAKAIVLIVAPVVVVVAIVVLTGAAMSEICADVLAAGIGAESTAAISVLPMVDVTASEGAVVVAVVLVTVPPDAVAVN